MSKKKVELEYHIQSITECDIKTIILNGEQDTVEFKEKYPSNSKLAKIVLSMLNSGGGSILIGVTDDKNIVGCDPKDSTDISNQLSSYIDEKYIECIHCSNTSMEDVGGKIVQCIIVTEPVSDDMIVSNKCSGDVKKECIYIRTHTSTREASHQDIARHVVRKINRSMKYRKSEIHKHLEQLQILFDIEKDDLFKNRRHRPRPRQIWSIPLWRRDYITYIPQ